MRNAHRQPYLETESAGQKHGAVELEPITYEAAERTAETCAKLQDK